MKIAYKIQKIIAVILLFAIVLLFENSVINWHYHVLPNGEVICHAHPYKKQHNDTSQDNSHSHSDKDLIILQLITNPNILLTFLFTALCSIFLPFYRINYSFNFLIPYKEYYKLSKERAPPI